MVRRDWSCVLVLGLRLGLGAAIAGLVLGVLRWSPVEAAGVFGVTATGAGVAAVVLAATASLFWGWNERWRCREAIWLAGTAAVALTVLVCLRPVAGLVPLVRIADGAQQPLASGPVDLRGRDLDHLGPARRASVEWQGELRVPAGGVSRLTVEGRGRLTIRIDGRPVFEGRGDVLRDEVEARIAPGRHTVHLTLLPEGPGLRLRLGWVRPGPFGAVREEPIPARFLGQEPSRLVWWATDALALLLALPVGWLAVARPWAARPLPAPSIVSRRETALSLAGYAFVLAIMSWPLVTDPAHLGVMDRPDGRLNAWIMAWDAEALAHEPSRLFQPKVFHPLPDSLAFSENLLLPAAVVAPLNLLGWPVLAYNVVLLASFALSGLGVERIVRRITGDPLAAFVAGAFFAAGPHRWTRLAHLHAQVTVFLPLALLAFDRYLERPTWRRASIVGLVLGLQGLSSVYLGAITAAALGIALTLALLAGLRLGPLVRILAGLALAGVMLLPLVAPYLRMRQFQGMEFDMAQVAAHASTLESYVASGTRLLGPITAGHIPPDRVQDTLFPGVTVLVLGLVGLVAAPKRFRVFAIVGAIVAIVVSLGPATPVYRFLHEHVVLVRGIRALSRFSLIPILSLSVLAGIALAGRRSRLTLAALALMMLESTNAPIGWDRYAGPSPVAKALAGGTGAVVVLPLGAGDTAAMLDSLAHGRALVNGDSGFIPRPYTRAMELLTLPLSPDALRLLRALGVTSAVGVVETGLPVVRTVGTEHILAIPEGPVARPPERGTEVPTLWSAGQAMVDLGAERELSGIGFALSDAEWVNEPEVEVSADGRQFRRVEAHASLADATLSLYAEPRRGRGVVRFSRIITRYVRLDRRLAAATGPLEALP